MSGLLGSQSQPPTNGRHRQSHVGGGGAPPGATCLACSLHPHDGVQPGSDPLERRLQHPLTTLPAVSARSLVFPTHPNQDPKRSPHNAPRYCPSVRWPPQVPGVGGTPRTRHMPDRTEATWGAPQAWSLSTEARGRGGGSGTLRPCAGATPSPAQAPLPTEHASGVTGSRVRLLGERSAGDSQTPVHLGTDVGSGGASRPGPILTASEVTATFCASSSSLLEATGGAFLDPHTFQAHGEAGPTARQGPDPVTPVRMEGPLNPRGHPRASACKEPVPRPHGLPHEGTVLPCREGPPTQPVAPKPV